MDATGDPKRGTKTGGLARLQLLDRRIIFGVLFVAAVFSFVVPLMPGRSVGPETRAVFAAVESCPPDKVILIDSSWDMGSQSENRAQLRVLVEHMFRENIKFVVTSIGVTPLAPELAKGILTELAQKYGKVYGTDYVQLGYLQGAGAALSPLGFVIGALARDIHSIYPKDVYDTPVSELPLMQRVRSIEQIHLVICITYAPSEDWISFIRGQYGTPVVFANMSIMVPYYVTYIESGQLAGMIVGTRGAAEYESLLKLEKPGEATRLMTPQAFTHMLIIAFIVLGNVGYLAARRKGR
jgi:hypothetical protein